MCYEYFYQNIAEWLLLSMLIFIDSSLQILILDFFLIFFINAAPTGTLAGFLLTSWGLSWPGVTSWKFPQISLASSRQSRRKL